METVFVYGTLMCLDIMQRVTGCQPRFEKAVLDGYFRSKISGVDYPGMVGRDGSKVEGIVYFGINRASINTLDRFEGEQYERVLVQVTLASGVACRAMTYVFAPQFHHLLTGEPWYYDQFLLYGKKRFEHNYLGFRQT